MDRVSMVQLSSCAFRKSSTHSDLHSCQYNSKLSLAQIFQLLACERVVIMGYVLFALVAYFAPFIYFLLSGSDTAIVIWLLVSISILLMVF
jgi:hypothetical protein